MPTIFDYEFMRYAFIAAGLVSIMASSVGYFLVIRGQSFAGHALSHVGFTGATGALIVGLSPITGMIVATLTTGLAMGALGEKLAGRDIAIGVVLSLALGLGLLFSKFVNGSILPLSALLFGNILSVDSSTLTTLVVLFFTSLIALAVIARPLLFATMQPELAEAKGVHLRGLSALFLCIVSLAVAASAQVVGALLVFSLLIAPAATAINLTRRISFSLFLSMALALCQSWFGILIAFYTDWPVSFCITLLGSFFFALSFFRRAN